MDNNSFISSYSQSVLIFPMVSYMFFPLFLCLPLYANEVHVLCLDNLNLDCLVTHTVSTQGLVPSLHSGLVLSNEISFWYPKGKMGLLSLSTWCLSGVVSTVMSSQLASLPWLMEIPSFWKAGSHIHSMLQDLASTENRLFKETSWPGSKHLSIGQKHQLATPESLLPLSTEGKDSKNSQHLKLSLAFWRRHRSLTVNAPRCWQRRFPFASTHRCFLLLRLPAW